MANYRLRIGHKNNYLLNALGGSYSLSGQVALFTYTPVSGGGPNDRYVRAGATGSNNGSNWTNAWTTLQAATDSGQLVNGSTVWIAGGNYNKFNIETNGSTWKKATVASHGTSTGWSDSYDTQVVISSTGNASSAIEIGRSSFTARSNITIDGQKRDSLTSGYGIVLRGTNYNGLNGDEDGINAVVGCSGLTVRYVEIGGASEATKFGEDCIQGNGNNLLIEYCYLHNQNVRFISGNPEERHGDGIQWTSGSNATYRYNYFRHNGQHIYMGEAFNFSNCFIYYNLFDNTGTDTIGSSGHFINGGGSPGQGTISNWQIYNNTFFSGQEEVDSGNHNAYFHYYGNGYLSQITSRNNIYIRADADNVGSGTHSHNGYCSSGAFTTISPPTETGRVMFGTTAANFVSVTAFNQANPDFNLLAGSPLRGAGTNVSSVAVNSSGQLVDILGRPVTNANAPDIGAFQYTP